MFEGGGLEAFALSLTKFSNGVYARVITIFKEATHINGFPSNSASKQAPYMLLLLYCGYYSQ